MSGPLRIGVTTFGGDGGKSGISRYITALLKEFAAMETGAHFDVLVFEEERDVFIPPDSPFAVHAFGPGRRPPAADILWHLRALPGLCRRLRWDVLFLPAGNRRLPFRVACATAGTVHDFSALHVPGKYDPLRSFYIRKVLPRLVRRLTRVLTVSESSARDIRSFARVPAERITVTPLAADTAVYHPRDAADCARRMGGKYGFEPPYVLYVSRIEHPGKNHVRLIQAFAGLARRLDFPHRLVLAGSDWGRAEEVHRAAAESGLGDRVAFTGFAPPEDVPELLCGASAFVFPSLYEGFGLPVLEAMSCGVPVACSNVSSIPEVAGDAAALFDPLDEAAIAAALQRLLAPGPEAADFARRGLERSRRFSWRRTAEQTLEVLRAAAGTAGRKKEARHER